MMEGDIFQQDDALRKALMATHFVAEADLAQAQVTAKKTRVSLLDVLFANGLLTHSLFGQAIAESLNVPYADLGSHPPAAAHVVQLPEEIAQKYHAVPFVVEEKEVTVATSDPTAKDLVATVRKVFPKKKIVIAYGLSQDIRTAMLCYRKPLETRFAKILSEGARLAPELLTQIFEDALAYRASDIHFEPLARAVIIRFRVDGMLYEAGTLPKEHYENILNRIKVQAHLRIDQHANAQDGAIRTTIGESQVDMRVSVVPTLDGEKVVIRLLAQYVRGFDLADLGLNIEDRERVRKAAKKPFGMILVSGPTGSGKTTTLYALLKTLHSPEVNIMTIEDPVEYRISGVNQIQVNAQTNLSFAQGLRAIVRQDPNVILVGEIRDHETAEIAVNAALTGHLLLSTFHANDAATAIPRLLDMGIEPFLLASTLELVVAQRLVRRICPSCRVSGTMTAQEIEKLHARAGNFFSTKDMYYSGKGCAACNNTGYAGRVAIFECIAMTKELQDCILRHPSSREIWQIAAAQGCRSLFMDGMEKVKNGMTSIEELLRVAIPPETGLPGAMSSARKPKRPYAKRTA